MTCRKAMLFPYATICFVLVLGFEMMWMRSAADVTRLRRIVRERGTKVVTLRIHPGWYVNEETGDSLLIVREGQ